MGNRSVEPNEEDLIRAWLDRHEIELRGPQPGRVESYDPTLQVADVMPMLRLPVEQADGSHVQEDPPVVPSVPVLWPRVGAWFLSMPIAPGDFVLLVPCEGDWSKWWAEDAGLSDVPDVRRHHLAHCVALPGFFPRPRALAQTGAADSVVGGDTRHGLVLGSDTSNARLLLKDNGNADLTTAGARITLQANGTVEIAQGGTVVARIDTTGTVYLGGVAGDLVALSSLVNAQFSSLIAAFNAHTHGVVGSVASPPMPPLVAAGSVAATKVKAT